MSGITDFFQDTNNIVKLIIYVLIIGVVGILASTIFSFIEMGKDKKKKMDNIIHGTNDLERGLEMKATTKKDREKANKKQKKTKIPFADIYIQYLFFGGTKRKFWLVLILGYIGFFTVYFILSRNVVLALILACLYFVIWYVLIENKVKKTRINYLKSFVSCLDIISSSIQAGNSFEEAVYGITKRDRINPRMQKEFTILSNNIKSNIPIDEALDRFLARNSLFSEFSMFVIVIQFFIKSGGRNMKKIFSSLQTSLNQKVENYSLIEGSLTQYQMCFNLFLVIELVAPIVAPIFLSGFYDTIVSSTMGYIKVIGSVVLAVFCTYMFKSSIKSAAEA